MMAEMHQYIPWVLQLGAIVWWGSKVDTVQKALIESVKEIKDDFKRHMQEDIAKHAVLTKMILDVMIDNRKEPASG